MILLILHLRPWDTGKLPPTGHIMSPSGCKLLPSGLEPAALWPSGSNLQPSGDIIFGPRAATFPVSRGLGAELSHYVIFICDYCWVVYFLSSLDNILYLFKMGKNCAAYGCDNSSKDRGVSFHSFPKDYTLRQKWAIAVRFISKQSRSIAMADKWTSRLHIKIVRTSLTSRLQIKKLS